MRGVIAMIGMLAGCDTVYGLHDRPVVDGPSGDDGPGGGDATEIDAPTGPHDEDHDSIPDADDNCPGLANTGQEDADRDDIGNVCDPLNSLVKPNHRLLFDPFMVLGTDWTPNTAWTGDGETVGPMSGQPTNNEPFRLTHRSIPVVLGSGWSIDVGFVLPSAPETTKLIGVHPVDVSSSSSWTCAVSYTGSEWRLTMGGGPTAPTVTTDPLVLRTQGNGAQADTNRCGAVSGSEVSTPLQPVPYPLFPQLFTQSIVRFQFIDVIQ